MFPPAKTFGDLYDKDARKARRVCRRNFGSIAAELKKIGVNVDCAPVLDVPVAGANEKVVGDRPFSFKTSVISDLGAVACRALSDGGVLPIIKHIPGHGRATTDSHFELPVVTEPLDVLRKTDFKTFRALATLPCALSGESDVKSAPRCWLNVSSPVDTVPQARWRALLRCTRKRYR